MTKADDVKSMTNIGITYKIVQQDKADFRSTSPSFRLLLREFHDASFDELTNQAADLHSSDHLVIHIEKNVNFLKIFSFYFNDKN